MKVLRRLRLSSIVTVMVWGAVIGVMFAGNFNPSRAADDAAPAGPTPTFVGMKTCVVCHAKAADPWLAGAHGKVLSDETLPADAFGCEACHGAGSLHVGSTGKQPMPQTCRDKSAAEAVCMKCHMRGDDSKLPSTWLNLNPRNWRRTRHARSNTACLTCHQIHSTNEHALSQPPADLCLSCHKQTVINPEAGGYTHTPVATGQCLLCHTPHGGSARHNLVDKVAAACLSCHPITDALRATHGQYAVDEANCTSCHNPHSFDRARKLIRKTEHAPFRKCGTCHVASEGTVKPALLKPQKQLCLGCHPAAKIMPEKTADGKPIKGHAPVQQGLCTTCHNPHASDRETLMKDRVDNACFMCHSKTEDETLRPFEHKPVTTGNCLLCHSPHGSPNDKLLVKPPLEQCQPCHATQMKFSHPVGMRGNKPVIDPTTKKMLTCARCHALHGSNVANLLPNEEIDLCRGCHKH